MESICLEFMDACGKFGDLERSVRVVDPFVWNPWMHVESARVARGAVESNSSFFSSCWLNIATFTNGSSVTCQTKCPRFHGLLFSLSFLHKWMGFRCARCELRYEYSDCHAVPIILDFNLRVMRIWGSFQLQRESSFLKKVFLCYGRQTLKERPAQPKTAVIGVGYSQKRWKLRQKYSKRTDRLSERRRAPCTFCNLHKL